VHVLVAGCGWLGAEVARALRARGDRVTGVRRSVAGAAALAPLGVEPLALDLADPRSARALPEDADAIVSCVAADGDDEAAYRRAYVDANRVLLAAATRPGLRAFVYTGSTGVFGQSDGGDVDETTEPAPAGPTARVLVEAERAFLEAAAAGIETRIVRLSGLYGPGRTGVVDRVREGKLALGPGDDAWTNWCHRDDAVALVTAALDRGRPGAVYHGTDALPARRRDVVRWISERLGIEPPARGESGAIDPGRRGANRRVIGERTRDELGLVLRFPSFREGLAPLIPARDASRER
jgi:nucleoside-diphosphate-sugar epimerase